MQKEELNPSFESSVLNLPQTPIVYDSGGMAGKLTHEEAAAIALTYGFEPIDVFPGNGRTSWTCKHISCGRTVELKLANIKAGKNSCKFCNGQFVDPLFAVSKAVEVGLEPLEPYINSTHKWRCRCLKCGAEVSPQYSTIISNGSGCRFCAKAEMGKKRRVDESFAIQTMLAAGYKPLEPYTNSQTRWRSIHVECGRQVSPTYGQIRSGNGGCKHCAGVYVDPIAAVEVMRNAGYEPLEPYVNSGHKWKCRCLTCGKNTTPSYGEARVGSRCKYCAKKAVKPEDAIQIMRNGGFEPMEDYPGSMEPWMCRHVTCGGIRFPRYAYVQQGRRACKTCSSKVVAAVLRLDPNEAVKVMRAAELEPLEPYPGTNNKPWKCIHVPCGREVQPRYAAIQQGQGGCKPCHQQRLALKYQTPAAEAVEVMRSAGFEPQVPFPGRTHEPWECIHNECGRTVTPALSNIKNGATCIYCAGKRIDDSDAISVMEHAGLKPLEPFPGRVKPWRCLHVECGREVKPLYSTVQSGNGGCVYCSGGRIHPDDATKLFRNAGFEPIEPFPGTEKPWRCTHVCGREVSPTYSNVYSGGGCKFCSDSGFKYDAPGIVYLMSNSDFQVLKIGITTKESRTDRIRDHELKGWHLVKSWSTETGLDAEIIESAVLKWWRHSLGAPPALSSSQMPSGGHTETAALIHVEETSTIEFVDFLVDELGPSH